jgi:trehalose 6-phosphate phosphatase
MEMTPSDASSQRERPAVRTPARLQRAAGRGARRPHLFRHWAEVAARLRSAPRIALFLDFDGTLTPLRRRPEDVVLDPATRRRLADLARHRRLKTWIISGRRCADLRRRVGVKGPAYLGLHGWEGSARGHSRTPGQRLLRRAKAWAARALGSTPGIRLEDKGAIFAVHYRGARNGDVRRARRIMARLMEGFEPALWMLAGKKVWEVLPREIAGKGEAVRAILARQPAGTLAVYLGDDTTDEEAFRCLPDAVTVRVGRGGRTRARFRLRHPAEVRRFLQKLESTLSC